MTFINMRDLLNKHFEYAFANQVHLFEVAVDKDELWNTYLDAFPAGTNNIFRQRREYDCSCCRGFIKNLGNVVAIINNKIVSIWDFEIDDPVFGPVVKAMSEFIHSHATICDVYLSTEKKIGAKNSPDNLTDIVWDHFYAVLDDRFVVRYGKNTALNSYRTGKATFKRALDEISLETIDIVLELIKDGSLYRGEPWEAPLLKLRQCKVEYDALQTDEEKDLYAWSNSAKLNNTNVPNIRNTSLGTLLVDIEGGRDLQEAVDAYGRITDPLHYKRPKPAFSKAQREAARKKIMELGFMDSLARRFATLDDITVNDILFTDRSAATRIKGAEDIFDKLAKYDTSKPKKFDRVETITIDKFLRDVLPTARSISAYVENKHAPNFVSLIAPVNPDAKSMFAWGNNFGWAYKGNATDSFKELVKAFGGNIDAVLRFSIKWNEDGKDNVDLDAHAITPKGTEIQYSHKRDDITGGQLDVDIIEPSRDVPGDDKTAVENIFWSDLRRMTPGEYKFFVHQYSGSARNGFRAEIEFNGETYSFDYPKTMRSGEKVPVATVTLDERGNFSIKTDIPSSNAAKTIWGVTTNDFVPVTSVMYSPNYWSTAERNVGHRHVFFMLDGCVSDETPSGIFNEFLVPELNENRRVMAAIGNEARVEPTNDQISGLGFATDKRNELVVKVTGASERVMKITF